MPLYNDGLLPQTTEMRLAIAEAKRTYHLPFAGSVTSQACTTVNGVFLISEQQFMGRGEDGMMRDGAEYEMRMTVKTPNRFLSRTYQRHTKLMSRGTAVGLKSTLSRNGANQDITPVDFRNIQGDRSATEFFLRYSKDEGRGPYVPHTVISGRWLDEMHIDVEATSARTLEDTLRFLEDMGGTVIGTSESLRERIARSRIVQ